jgi:hypothetical protein
MTAFLISVLFLAAILVMWIFAAITRLGPYKVGPLMGVSLILVSVFTLVAIEKKFPILVNSDKNREERIRDLHYLSLFGIILGLIVIVFTF